MRSVSIAVLCFEPVVLAVWLWSVFGTTVSALRRLLDGSQVVWSLLALLSLGLGTLATLREGKRMADVVQRYRLNTRVEGECFSARTLVLLAGANRSAGERALIGFHRGRSIGESADDRAQPARAEETELYRRAGLKPEFVRRIVGTPNDAIWIPSRSELLREEVLTR